MKCHINIKYFLFINHHSLLQWRLLYTNDSGTKMYMFKTTKEFLYTCLKQQKSIKTRQPCTLNQDINCHLLSSLTSTHAICIFITNYVVVLLRFNKTITEPYTAEVVNKKTCPKPSYSSPKYEDL